VPLHGVLPFKKAFVRSDQRCAMHDSSRDNEAISGILVKKMKDWGQILFYASTSI
jgi:hypothetical protein